MKEATREQCGTQKGIDLHAELGEAMCGACSKLRRRQVRATPEGRAKRQADSRALSALRARHEGEYQALYSRHYEIALQQIMEKEEES